MEGLKRWKIAVRQGLFGVLMGAIPGVAGAVIDWLAYASASCGRRTAASSAKVPWTASSSRSLPRTRRKEEAAIPTLAFGVPGSGVWAIVLTAMLVYGITPGPQMMNQYAHLTIVMVITLALANVALTMLGLVSSSYLRGSP